MNKQRMTFKELLTKVAKDLPYYRSIITDDDVFNNVLSICDDARFELDRTYKRLYDELNMILDESMINKINILAVEITNKLPKVYYDSLGNADALSIGCTNLDRHEINMRRNNFIQGSYVRLCNKKIISDMKMNIPRKFTNSININMNQPSKMIQDIPEVFLKLTKSNVIDNMVTLSIIVYLTNKSFIEFDEDGFVADEMPFTFVRKTYNIECNVCRSECNIPNITNDAFTIIHNLGGDGNDNGLDSKTPEK